ncbi:hypothetical protein CALCODRAFT_509770 [Calocera cornea HHB12733]|uniref:Uncharacterized protein n=1 Tax=Calocera cornea HHB12733 TaxID=1353952 RepID=A0A165F274_9BASI|nr:hypothetical protein CALCODRAFT_509770 [Calocera cornea HHB12733]
MSRWPFWLPGAVLCLHPSQLHRPATPHLKLKLKATRLSYPISSTTFFLPADPSIKLPYTTTTHSSSNRNFRCRPGRCSNSSRLRRGSPSRRGSANHPHPRHPGLSHRDYFSGYFYASCVEPLCNHKPDPDGHGKSLLKSGGPALQLFFANSTTGTASTSSGSSKNSINWLKTNFILIEVQTVMCHLITVQSAFVHPSRPFPYHLLTLPFWDIETYHVSKFPTIDVIRRDWIVYIQDPELPFAFVYCFSTSTREGHDPPGLTWFFTRMSSVADSLATTSGTTSPTILLQRSGLMSPMPMLQPAPAPASPPHQHNDDAYEDVDMSDDRLDDDLLNDHSSHAEHEPPDEGYEGQDEDMDD